MFSPEFRNRLDAIVTFKPLTPRDDGDHRREVHAAARVAARRAQVAITLEPAARAWLAVKGYDPVFGARPLARVMQAEVRDRLTDEILFGQLEHGGTVRIGLDGDQLAFTFEAATPVA